LPYFYESTKVSKHFSGVTAPNITEYTHDVATFIAFYAAHPCSNIPIRFGMATGINTEKIHANTFHLVKKIVKIGPVDTEIAFAYSKK